MSYSVTTNAPPPSLTYVLSGSVASINTEGNNYATGSVLYDFYGGSYGVTSVDASGHVLAVSGIQAPFFTGYPPPSQIPTFNTATATGDGTLTLNMLWAPVAAGFRNTMGAIAFGSNQILGSPSFPSQFPGYVSGNWYQPMPVPQTAAGTALDSSTTIVGFFANILEACSIANLAVDITTALAASTFEVAIYTNGSWGMPSTLVCSGSGSSAATGIIAAAVAGGNLNAQGYWFMFMASGATNVALGMSVTQGNPSLGFVGSNASGSALGTAALANGIQVTGQTYGTWPTFTSGTVWTHPTTTIVPVQAFQVSSP